MAQPTLLPDEPQAAAQRTPTPASSTTPPSPTKSLWKRLLTRGSSAHPEQLTSDKLVEKPSLNSPRTGVLHSPAPDDLEADNNFLVLSEANASEDALESDSRLSPKPAGSSRRTHRDVVPNLPRAQTFARQQSELRGNLLQVLPTHDERRATSVDRRLTRNVSSPSSSIHFSNHRSSAPSISRPLEASNHDDYIPEADASLGDVLPVLPVASLKTPGGDGSQNHDDFSSVALSAQRLASVAEQHSEGLDRHSLADNVAKETDHVDTTSMTSSEYEQRIRYELEHVWILNLSMHFRDRSRREKFFVTYRQRPDLSRRVTISLDYRNAPEASLEMDLLNTKIQRDKNEMIYEAIRESLGDIQFYSTVTNLKLQTTGGRLHVHVVEDISEIIEYPSSHYIQHLGCRKIKENDVEFDCHMSGFVYKVRVDDQTLIKKEIPGPDSVDEFLYEINALNSLRDSRNVIELYGVVISDDDRVTGLLISFAEQGALIDVLYENNHGIPWYTRLKWARQIVHGLSEVHEAGFVQGDFTLSNIVIDGDGNAKIIDINRRGCPVGWEPPEATPLIESDQRISMYIGVKSDLYQLGMVLWALATQYDDPEAHGRPLHLDNDVGVPQWYKTIVETCLAENPRVRAQARQLLSYFPSQDIGPGRLDDSDYEDEWVEGPQHNTFYAHSAPSGSLDDGNNSFRCRAGIESKPSSDYSPDEVRHFEGIEGEIPIDKYKDLAPRIKTVTPTNDWAYVNFGHTYVDPSNGVSNEPYYYPTRGRSPPSTSRIDSVHDSVERAPSWTRTRSLEKQGANASPTSKADASSECIPYNEGHVVADSDKLLSLEGSESNGKPIVDENADDETVEKGIPFCANDDDAELEVNGSKEHPSEITEPGTTAVSEASNEIADQTISIATEPQVEHSVTVLLESEHTVGSDASSHAEDSVHVPENRYSINTSSPSDTANQQGYNDGSLPNQGKITGTVMGEIRQLATLEA